MTLNVCLLILKYLAEAQTIMHTKNDQPTCLIRTWKQIVLEDHYFAFGHYYAILKPILGGSILAVAKWFFQRRSWQVGIII